MNERTSCVLIVLFTGEVEMPPDTSLHVFCWEEKTCERARQQWMCQVESCGGGWSWVVVGMECTLGWWNDRKDDGRVHDAKKKDNTDDDDCGGADVVDDEDVRKWSAAHVLVVVIGVA